MEMSAGYGVKTVRDEEKMAAAGDRILDMPSGDGLQLQARAANESMVDTQDKPASGFLASMRTAAGYLLILMIVYFGWQHRDSAYISPEEGPGYALGIIGGSLLLLLLIYPLRKHLRWTQCLGPVRYWFRAHMLMGIIGPVCILYHCNYRLGSANSNIALFSMLLVAGSGLAGRYFYAKMHLGLYGKKADLARLKSDGAMAMSSMRQVLEASPGLFRGLQSLEQQAVRPLHGILPGLVRVLAVGFKARWYGVISGPVMRRAIRKSGLAQGHNAGQRRKLFRQTRHSLQVYLQTVCKVAGLAFFERLFSFWHILHLPLFFMLLISGVVHVYAVHVY
jgi:hypothetical protein